MSVAHKDFVSADVYLNLISPEYSSMTSIMYNFLIFINVEIISKFFYLLNCRRPLTLSLVFPSKIILFFS